MGKFKTLLLIGTVTASIGLTGCASWGHRDPGRTAGRVVDDNRITDRIETGLRQEPVYKFQDVDVRTYNGVVQLSGFVMTQDQRQRAEEIAQNTPGVAQVVNNIVMKDIQNLTPTGRTTYPAVNQTGSTTNAPAVDEDLEVDR